MAKFTDDSVLDAACNKVATATRMVVTSAQLTAETDPDGYVLVGDFVLPAVGFYKFAAEVITAAAPESVVVAVGHLRVDPRVPVDEGS